MCHSKPRFSRVYFKSFFNNQFKYSGILQPKYSTVCLFLLHKALIILERITLFNFSIGSSLSQSLHFNLLLRKHVLCFMVSQYLHFLLSMPNSSCFFLFFSIIFFCLNSVAFWITILRWFSSFSYFVRLLSVRQACDIKDAIYKIKLLWNQIIA